MNPHTRPSEQRILVSSLSPDLQRVLGGDYATKDRIRQAENGVALADTLKLESSINVWIAEAKVDLPTAAAKIPGFKLSTETSRELEQIADCAGIHLIKGATWEYDLVQRELTHLKGYYDQFSSCPDKHIGPVPGYRKSTGPGSRVYMDSADQLAYDTTEALKYLMRNVPGFITDDILGDSLQSTLEGLCRRAERFLTKPQNEDPFFGMKLPKII